MPEPRRLKHAPIREAVVDIRVPPVPPSSLDALRELAKGLEYPVVHEAFEFLGQFNLGPQGMMAQGQQSRPSGFRAVSESRSQIVQFRLNGMAVSRLEPYESWEQLVAEAKQLWLAFREAAHPEGATRLGLRYINHVRVPYPGSDLRDYFAGLPDLPKEWPQAVSSFLFRQTLHDDLTGAAVNITHALADDVDEDRIGVIFDIDAYREASFGVDDPELWGTFGDLRDLKNRIFFSGVTEATLSLCD